MVSPDSQAPACLPSGRNSTYRPVQISATGSAQGSACSTNLELGARNSIDASTTRFDVDVLAQAQIHHLRQRELDHRRSASEFAPLHTRDTPVKFQIQS